MKTLGKKVVTAVRVPEEMKKDIESLGFQVSAFVRQAIKDELRIKRLKRL